MTEPTPGPWKAELNDIGNGITPWRIVGADEQVVADSPVGPHAFDKANAHLMAAAPAMLDALRGVAERLENYPNRISGYTDSRKSGVMTLLEDVLAAIEKTEKG